MKKGILLLFCSIYLCAISNAQSTFVKTLGGAGDDLATCAINTKDGNILVIGSTTSFGNGGSDGYVAKINNSAKEIWDKAIGGIEDDHFQYGIQLANDDFLLIGWTSSFGNGGEDMLVTKLDKFGNLIWTRTFGGVNGERGHSAIETSDGSLVVAGHTQSFGSGSLDAFIVKLNPDGSEIWSKAYGTSGNDWFTGEGIIEDTFGDYVLTGSYQSGSGTTPHEGFFLKLDSDGNIIIINGYGDSNDEGLNGFLKESATGYQNIGTSWSWNGPNHEIWMSDFDVNGDLNWSKTFGFPGEDIRIGLTEYTDDGHYLISGFEFTQHTNATGRAILLKVSITGEVIWSKSFGDAGMETLDVVLETENGIIAFGKTTSYGQGGNDIYVVRTDQFGTVSGCSDTYPLTTTDVNPLLSNPNFSFEDLSLGESQTIDVSNVDNQESVVCDGCDAADLEAGLFCETAPVICSIDCLDGFTATMPDTFYAPQPFPTLCNGGFPNNVSWFAFVAGSNTIDLSIIPSNCDTIFNESGAPETLGIQVGIYEDCSFENSFFCHTQGCFNLIAETVNVSSNQFQIGHTYYLFVDGCGGSVCDYEVVVNSAQQAFEMDEITTISNNLNLDLDQDTICQGAELTFTLDNFDQNVNFNWSIDPPTSEFPSGVHSITDTSSVAFHFSEEGCFDIHVYAFNDCDNSETQSFSICVKALEDEYFSDISVCQECFPITLVSPEAGCIITEGEGAPTVLIEDPNGDGVPGWLGTSTIDGPGLDSNLVTNIYGCTYTQYVNVVEIPISPREQVEYYFCLTDFPVDINGFTFNSPGDTRNITLEGAAASGCDSLMSITAHGVDLFGSSSVGNCESGEVELAFDIGTIVPMDYDSISYTWYDQNADVVLDFNGIDSILVVTGVGSYSVQVEVHVGAVSCPQTFGPFMVDVDNSSPDVPSIGYAPLEICVSELQAQIYMNNQGLGENYIWTFTPNMPISFGLTSDTVYVDLIDGQDFEFCVHAVNGCGASDEICDVVEVHENPDSEFTYDAEVCTDSVTIIEYTGAFGTLSSSVFTWDFDGGTILNGAVVTTGGPFEIGFANSGLYTIGLTLTEAGCSSIHTEYQVNVVDPFTAPMVECEGGAGSVTFSWDDTNVIDVDVIVLSGQSSYELGSNSFIVNGLNSEEDVTIQIEFNSGDACGGVTVTENCASFPCPEVDLELLLSNQNLCLDVDSDVTLDIAITGDNSGLGNWESPFIYNDNLFDIVEAGLGEHLLTYTYVIDDCTYSKDTVLSIFNSPEVEVEIFLAYCEEMGNNMIDILTSQDNGVLLDSESIEDFNNIEVEVGDHTISVVGEGGCSTELNFQIESFVVENLEIVGEEKIFEGQSTIYTATVTTNLDDLVFIWTMDGDTICMNCIEVEITPNEDVELCLHLVYGEDCVLSDCLFVEIGKRTEIYIPNVFSPNNDNINDLFTIGSNGTDAFINEIMIFDRWGEMVHNQKGFNVGEESHFWDGNFNGKMCIPGVYVYIINYLDEENQVKKVSGDLTLVR